MIRPKLAPFIIKAVDDTFHRSTRPCQFFGKLDDLKVDRSLVHGQLGTRKTYKTTYYTRKLQSFIMSIYCLKRICENNLGKPLAVRAYKMEDVLFLA